MLVIRGARSEIAKKVAELYSGSDIVEVHRDASVPIGDHYYLFCQGLIRPLRLEQQSPKEMAESVEANALGVMRACETILSMANAARICIVGSESGFAWGYDGVYAFAKAGLHRYIETKKCRPGQQIVGIAPGIIDGTGMTNRRTDHSNLMSRQAMHPKRRFLSVSEVANLAHFLLFVDRGYICNQVIRMNGGEHLK